MKLTKNLASKETYKNCIHALSTILLFSIVYIIFFSPVIFSSRLLAPGDGIIHSVPSFYSPRTLWTDLILSGFPVAADPTIQMWYPIQILFSLISHSWNAYVISAYVLSSSFTYGYVYTVTNSRLASTVSGIIYGMSGFMMAHLGHTMIIHTAVWLPLLIWSLEKLRYDFSSKWFVSACLAVACSILAGHPQITTYSLALSSIYFVTLGCNNLTSNKWKNLKLLFIILALGIGLGAVQAIPTAELSSFGLRTKFSFQEFNSYALPLKEAIQFLFPYLFGGGMSPPYQTPYFGTWGLTETTGYVSITAIVLAFIGILSSQNKKVSIFWGFTALISFLLALGDATPLSSVVYHLPLFNKFRVPSRHFLESTLSFSVLAGIGIVAIQKQIVSQNSLAKIFLSFIGFVIVAMIGIFLWEDKLVALSQEVLGKESSGYLNFLPWSNPALVIPFSTFILSVTLLVYWSKLPSSRVLKSLVVLLVVYDLGAFGWFYEWQDAAPNNKVLIPPVHAQKYSEILDYNHQRVLPVNGGLATLDELPGNNISRLWGIPNASGYGPLMLSRISDILSMSTSGIVQKNVLSEADKSLDIMSIGYVTFNRKIADTSSMQGINWSNQDMNISLGTGCNTQNPNTVRFSDFPIEVTDIGIVSSLACSTSIPNQTALVKIILTDKSGNSVNQELLAGTDTSEWAYDCPDVLPFMKHDRAHVFESFQVERDDYPTCQGHQYYSILPINKLSKVESIELNWLVESGAINLKKLSLINSETGESQPVVEEQFYLANTMRWTYIEDIGSARVYQNLRARPRSWLVPEVVNLKPDEILSTIKSSKFPTGETYDPSQVALIEENLDFKASDFDLKATSDFFKLDGTHIQVKTSSASPAFLILSDVNYPGWEAKVDGKATHIFQTNYVLRGILLPEGNHLVEFEFKSRTFHIGLGITSASLLLVAYISQRFRKV